MGDVVPFPSKPIVSAVSDIEVAIARDQWERPLILPEDGGDPVAYRRASSVVEALEDHYGLNVWKARMTAQGLAMRPDLLHSVHTATKSELNDTLEEAFVYAGGDVAARNGSTLHALTDKLNQGLDVPEGLPNNIIAMLEAYERTVLSRFEYLDGEKFVVCDPIKVAGTYDTRLRHKQTGSIHIGDLKSGQNTKYLAIKLPAQVAVYAAGKWYTLDGERESHGADRDRGLLIHLPWVEKPEDAKCELRWIDLRVGRAAIKEALRIDTFRKIKSSQTLLAVRD